MSAFSDYKSRIQFRGETIRDRALYHEKHDLTTKAINSLSCKNCLVNGVEQRLIIDDGTLPYYKNVKSLPDEYFDAGDMVEWADAMWLVVTCDWDKEVYTHGQLQQCNYLMKWQNANAEVIERWCVCMSASKYNNGNYYTNEVVIGSNQTMVYLPNDSETLKLHNDKRIFLDFNTENPKTYIITRVDTVTMSYDGITTPTYNGKGCILLIVTECEYNPDTDRIDLMLCDYVDPDSLTPTSPVVISYSGSPEIRIGGRKTFKTDSPATFSLLVANEWQDKITLTTIDDTSCRVNVALDSNMVGVSFKVVANNGQQSELLVKVVGAV